MTAVATEGHLKFATQLREVLATYEKQKDLILLGAYEKGADPRVDYAIEMIEPVTQFLKQGIGERAGFQDTVQRLTKLFA